MTHSPAAASPLDALLSEAVETGALPCVVAMAADRRGPFYAGAFGSRTIGVDQPVTPDTTFRIHSMTKPITAAAMMQLVERGEADLDSPASHWFAELARPRILDGFDADGVPRLKPARNPVTLRHLLTHTAGFSYDIWNADTLAFQKRTGFPGPFSGKLAVLGQPLAFEPGTRWHYSIGIDWVGRIVEKISGLDLETYFRRHIFEPLGMADTTFVQSEEQRARRVTMHRRQPDGSIAPFVLDRPDVAEYHIGGGGLFGTAPDYLRFTQAILDDGGPILKPETVALMAQNHIGDLDVEPMLTRIPQLSADCEFWPGTRKKWGLSFLINTEDAPEGRAAGSLAWAGLSNLYFWIDRSRGVTGVFASQMLPYYDPRAIATFRRFERAVYDSRA